MKFRVSKVDIMWRSDVLQQRRAASEAPASTTSRPHCVLAQGRQNKVTQRLSSVAALMLLTWSFWLYSQSFILGFRSTFFSRCHLLPGNVVSYYVNILIILTLFSKFHLFEQNLVFYYVNILKISSFFTTFRLWTQNENLKQKKSPSCHIFSCCFYKCLSLELDTKTFKTRRPANITFARQFPLRLSDSPSAPQQNPYLQACVCPSRYIMLHSGSAGAGAWASGLGLEAESPAWTCHQFTAGPRRETNTVSTRTCGLLELPVSPACTSWTVTQAHRADSRQRGAGRKSNTQSARWRR